MVCLTEMSDSGATGSTDAKNVISLRDFERRELSLRYNKMIDAVLRILRAMGLDTRLEVDAEFNGVTLRQEIFRKFNTVRLIIGGSNRELGQSLLRELGISEVACELGFFADRSPRVEIKENIRDTDIFILQTGANDEKYSLNDYSEQLIGVIDACKRSGSRSITILVPNYPNARSDKRDAPRVPIMAKVTTTKFETAGADRIVTLDLHSGQIQGFSDKPIDNLYAKPLFVEYLRENHFKGMTPEEINRTAVFVSPDAGGYKRVHAYSETMRVNNVTMHKERDYTVPNQVLKSILVGGQSEVAGKRCFLFDDMIDIAGTLIASVKELEGWGATEVIPVATHGIFSEPALRRIDECSLIKEVIVTNSLPQVDHVRRCTKKISVVDVAPLLAYTVVCIRFGGCISRLF